MHDVVSVRKKSELHLFIFTARDKNFFEVVRQDDNGRDKRDNVKKSSDSRALPVDSVLE